MRKPILVAGLAVVALGAAAVVAAPAYVRHRVVEEAAARGIVLDVHDTRLGLDGIHLQGITATTARVPNARLRADDVFASWDASQVNVTNAELAIDGPITPPTGAAAEEQPVPADGPTKLHLESSRVSWTHVAGDVATSTDNVTGDFALAPHLGDTFDVQGAVSLTIGNGVTLGPFQGRLSRDLAGEHARLALDPSDANANVLAFDHDGATDKTEWTVAKRPSSKLGIPLALLGIPDLNGDPVLDLHLVDVVTRPATGASTASGSLSFASDAITLPAQKDPSPASFSLTWKGDPDAKMPVDGGTFKAGPFTGTITGTVSRPLGAAAVDLAVASNSLPCSQFVKGDLQTVVTQSIQGLPLGGLMSGLGGKSSFDLLKGLGAGSGVESGILGNVKIAGNLSFDSRNPKAAVLTVAPVNDCHLEIHAGTP